MNLKDHIQNLLRRTWLDETEIRFYIEVLKNPQSSVYRIAKEAKISKNRAYQVFEALRSKGILESSISGSKKGIIPANLNTFIESIDRKSRSLGKTAEGLKRVNPLLPLIARTTNAKGSIKVFEGEDAIKENSLDLLRLPWNKVLAHGSFEMFAENFGFDEEKLFIRNRVKKGKKADAVFCGFGPYTSEVTSRDQNELRKSHFIDDETMKNKWVYTFDNVDIVAIWSKGEDGSFTATFVENKELADFHRAVFKTRFEQTR